MDVQVNYSAKSLSLLANEDVIRLKNKLIKQIELHLQAIGNQFAAKHPYLQKISPPPKVSKGEKHQGLPYLVLDFPRLFSQKDILAIRTVVWWSKHISISLILKGKYLDESLNKIRKQHANGKLNGLYVKYSGDLWSNRIVGKVNNQTKLPQELEFIKISFKFPLHELPELDKLHQHSMQHLLSLTPYDNY